MSYQPYCPVHQDEAIACADECEPGTAALKAESDLQERVQAELEADDARGVFVNGFAISHTEWV